MSFFLPCKFFDGKSSKTHQVYPIIESEFIQIKDDINWRFDELCVVEKPHSDNPGVITNTSSDDARLIVYDLKLFHLIQDKIPHKSLFKKYIIEGFIPLMKENAILITAIILVILSIPYVTSFIANNVDQEDIDKVGDRTFEYMVKNDVCNKNPSSIKDLAQLTHQLASNLDKSQKFEVYVINKKYINAFAIPRSRIVISQGLLDRMNSAEELSIIIGHEIGHIVKQHHRDLYAFNVLLSSISSSSVAILSSIINSKHSREDELEADEFSYELAVKNSIDPKHFILAFKVLKESGLGDNMEKFLSYIASHPATDDRIKIISQKIANKKFESKPVISQEKWENIKKICK